MKRLAFIALLLISFSALAENLRDQCENAYYADAGGVTQLHQYQAIVEFGRLSDHMLAQVEDLIYGEGPLKMIEERNFSSQGRQLTAITLKEIAQGFDRLDYIRALDQLAKFPGVKLYCK